MARNEAGRVNVKLPVDTVLVALSATLTKLEKDYKNQEKLEKEYKKTKAAWEKKAAREAMRQIGKVKSDDISINERYDGTVNVHIVFKSGTLTPEPRKEYQVIPEWEYKANKEEIESLIRILSLTEDEYINTSTYHSVSKYL